MEVERVPSRVLCRVLTYDPKRDSLLLVRNRGQSWWCAPGGSWNCGSETLKEAAVREVKEETGLEVLVSDIIAVQTLLLKNEGATWLELFWQAAPGASTLISKEHIDHFGIVDEARWLTHDECIELSIYPKAIKGHLWEQLRLGTTGDRRYLGDFVI